MTPEEKESRKQYMREYYQRPYAKAKRKAQYKSKEYRERINKYNQRDYVKQKAREYRSQDYVKQKQTEFRKRPEVIAARKQNCLDWREKNADHVDRYNKLEYVKLGKREYANKRGQDPEFKKERKQYREKPEVKRRLQQYAKTPNVKAQMKEYSQSPEGKLKKHLNYKKRMANDPEFAIRQRLRSRFNKVLKEYTKSGKIKPADEYGIDYEAIIKHLTPFPKDRHLYHIDHIIPLVSFNLEDPEQIKIAFAPQNHQWILIKHNLQKGAKLKYKIQIEVYE